MHVRKVAATVATVRARTVSAPGLLDSDKGTDSRPTTFQLLDATTTRYRIYFTYRFGTGHASLEQRCIRGCTATPPETWRCWDAYYAADDECDCECGAYDPDCDDPNEPVLGCTSESPVCGSDGQCTSR